MLRILVKQRKAKASVSSPYEFITLACQFHLSTLSIPSDCAKSDSHGICESEREKQDHANSDMREANLVQ